MNALRTPHSKDWDDFWNKRRKDILRGPSWSKRRILAVIAQYLNPGKNALDAGCGSGFFSKHFCDVGMNVTALDFSDEALASASWLSQGKVRTVKGDLRSAELAQKLSAENPYDVIFSDGLLEHFSMDEQLKIMENFCRMLKPGGLLITFVPNRWSPWELIRPFYMPGIEEKPFILSQLIGLNEKAQLRMVNGGGVNALPFRWSPDQWVGDLFGMLLFTIARKNG